MSDIIGGYREGRVRMIPEKQRVINVIGCEQVTPDHLALVCDDPRASFMFSRSAECEKPPDIIPLDKVDYGLLPPPELHDVYTGTPYEFKGIPLSFLNVQGVEEGTGWYRAHTRHSDEVCKLLAEYQWGNLRKGIDKKALKKARTKGKGKGKRKKKNKTMRAHISHEKTILKFD